MRAIVIYILDEKIFKIFHLPCAAVFRSKNSNPEIPEIPERTIDLGGKVHERKRVLSRACGSIPPSSVGNGRRGWRLL